MFLMQENHYIEQQYMDLLEHKTMKNKHPLNPLHLLQSHYNME